jgi:hypothetical protein
MGFLKVKCCVICVLPLISVLACNNSAFAEKFLYESYVATDPAEIEFFGDNPGGQFGAVLGSGDFNGDSIDDLIVGSPFTSSSGLQWNGSVDIIFGSSDFSKTTPEIELFGAFSGDQFGTSIETGDYNADGIDDIAISAFNAKSNTGRPGEVYIYYGENIWGNQSIDSSYYKPSVQLVGNVSGDGFGLSLSTLDVNKDNVDDLLVGAPFATSYYSSQRLDNAGVVYVYYGGDLGLSTVNDFKFSGQSEDGRFGSAINGGDFDADGKTDVVIGAYLSMKEDFGQAGKMYIYNGDQNFGSGFPNVANMIFGNINNGWFAFSLDVADVNGDAMDDIAVGSFPYFMQDEAAGMVSVFYGGAVFNGIADLIIEEPLYGNLIGSSVLLEDFNTDGKAEIVAGAPGVGNPVSTEEGDVYILYSGDYDPIDGLRNFSVQAKSVTSIIHGENADDWFGYSVASLDINNDGYLDLAVGSRYSDAGNAINNGKVFVLLGDNSPFGNGTKVLDLQRDYVARDETLSIVLEKFELKEKKADDIAGCYDYVEFCLFNFLAMSSYDDVQLTPDLILYPDILPTNKYYDDVVVATMLGLVNGYQNENDSPFYPKNSISRIQALKIVLSASDLVTPKYRFELIDELGSLVGLTDQYSYFMDVNPEISHMWWYPRYVNFAVEHNIVDDGDFFRPDEDITRDELNDIIDRTLQYLNS